jgi:hypothetical protein
VTRTARPRRGIRAVVLTLLATVAIVAPAVPSVATDYREFTDVPQTHVFAGEISWLQHREITTGYADGSFRPSAPVLREQMAAFLHRYAGRPVIADLPTTSPFTDVPTSHVFYAEIVWLARTGVTTGYADGSFRPSAPVLREQMAAFLFRFAGVAAADPEPSLPFQDVPASHVFASEIGWLAAEGISTGYGAPPHQTFAPSAPVLREQMAAFLFRTDEALPPVPVTAQPVVVGVPAVGQTLSVEVGDWEPDLTSVGYRWQVNGMQVSEYGPTLLVTPALAEATVGVVVTGRSSGHRPTTAFSGWVDIGSSPDTLRVAGRVASDTTWGAGGIETVVVAGDVTVPRGATLAIASGTRVVAESGRAIEVLGTLAAAGTAADPIRFTTPADAPGEGLWRGIRVRDGGSIDLAHAQVAHASIGIEVPGRSDGSAEVAASLAVRDTTFTDVQEHAIRVADTATAPVVQRTSTQGSGGSPIVLSSHRLDPSLVADNGGDDVGGPVLLGGTVATSGTLASGGLPFGVGHGTSGLTVAAGVTLTLPAGQVWASQAQSVVVEGELVVAGTAAAPVVLGSSGADPAPGDWGGIEVRDGGTLAMTHARIEHAVTGVKADRAPRVTIVDSTIADSDTGLFVYDGPPEAGPWIEQQVVRTRFARIADTAIVLNNARLVATDVHVEVAAKVLHSEYASAVLTGQLTEIASSPWVQALGVRPQHEVDVTGANVLPERACGPVTTASGPAPAC